MTRRERYHNPLYNLHVCTPQLAGVAVIASSPSFHHKLFSKQGAKGEGVVEKEPLFKEWL
jgi:hypothetical protein